jgi:hypothetical protein
LCEPLQRAIIIYHLKNGTFNDSILGDSISCNIIKYLDRRHSHYRNNEKYFYYIPINKEFDKYTESEAEKLIARYNKKSVEYLLCGLYSNKSDSILIKIKHSRYINSKIRTNPCKRSYKTSGNKKVRFGASLLTGLWIPTGDLTILGLHPELGFRLGLKRQNFSAEFSFIWKFLKTPDSYYARRIHTSDSIEPTNKFGGGYIGFDISKNIFTNKKSDVQLLAGLGFDGFPTFKEDENYEEVRSYNINLGIGYKYYYRKTAYIGIETKYNIVDYSMTGVTNLKGNYISIRFIWGHFDRN